MLLSFALPVALDPHNQAGDLGVDAIPVGAIAIGAMAAVAITRALRAETTAAFLLSVAPDVQTERSMSELQTVTAENLQLPTAADAIALPLVLIADANPISRLRRTRQLERRGFRVAVARTGFETIVKASCHLPELILVAASLGESDAEDTTKLLSRCPATAHIPIVHLARGRRIPRRLDTAAR